MSASGEHARVDRTHGSAQACYNGWATTDLALLPCRPSRQRVALPLTAVVPLGLMALQTTSTDRPRAFNHPASTSGGHTTGWRRLFVVLSAGWALTLCLHLWANWPRVPTVSVWKVNGIGPQGTNMRALVTKVDPRGLDERPTDAEATAMAAENGLGALTYDEYKKVAAHVVDTAPPGLSEAQFHALVDSEARKVVDRELPELRASLAQRTKSERMERLRWALAAWAIPLLGIVVLAKTTAWVWRGFFPSP